jgi:hypothetical protein
MSCPVSGLLNELVAVIQTNRESIPGPRPNELGPGFLPLPQIGVLGRTSDRRCRDDLGV